MRRARRESLPPENEELYVETQAQKNRCPQKRLVCRQQRHPDHLYQLCAGHCHRDAAAQPAHCQQRGAAGRCGRHVHGHQCHLCDGPCRPGHLDAVHLLWAGGAAAAHPGGRPRPCHPHQLFCAGSAAADGLPGSAPAGGERLGGQPFSGNRCAEDRDPAGDGLRAAGHAAAAARLGAGVRPGGYLDQRFYRRFGFLQRGL